MSVSQSLVSGVSQWEIIQLLYTHTLISSDHLPGKDLVLTWLQNRFPPELGAGKFCVISKFNNWKIYSSGVLCCDHIKLFLCSSPPSSSVNTPSSPSGHQEGTFFIKYLKRAPPPLVNIRKSPSTQWEREMARTVVDIISLCLSMWGSAALRYWLFSIVSPFNISIGSFI